MKEIRKKDPKTGAEKGTKLERHDLIPQKALQELATHYGVGSAKYEEHNWRKGYNWSWSYAALQRHALAFWNGEDYDPETNTKHVICVAWHALALATFMDEHKDKDDRFKPLAVDKNRELIQKCLDEMMISGEASDFANELLEDLTGEKVVYPYMWTQNTARRKWWSDYSRQNNYFYEES